LDNGYLLGAGGNQNDEVNVTSYSPKRMTDIRRSSKSLDHSKSEIAELHSIADDIINGKEIQTGGKVT